MLPFFAKKDSTLYLLKILLNFLNIKVSEATIKETLTQHPHFPSLLSISDALKEWKVDNLAIQLKKIEDIYELPTPFIAHTKLGCGGNFVLVKKVVADKIIWYDSNNTYGKKELLTSFSNKWTGNVLLVEANEFSGEENFQEKSKDEKINNVRIFFLLIASSILIFLGFVNIFNSNFLFLLPLFLTKIIGFCISFLLLKYTLEEDKSLINQFCNFNNRINCQQLLSSKGAKIWGNISWAEIGLLYFLFGITLISFFHDIEITKNVLSLTSLIVLPFTFYSIYYQSVAEKAFCTFCLAIQLILWVEFFLTLSFWPIEFSSNAWVSVPSLGFFILFPLILYMVFRPSIIEAQKVKDLEINLSKFKYDPNVFNYFLKKEKRMPSLLEVDPLIMGQRQEVANIITVVLSLTCKPCAAAYKELQKLSLINNIKIQIVIGTCNIKNQKEKKVIEHLFGLYDENPENLPDALDKWYGQKNKNFKTWVSSLSLQPKHPFNAFYDKIMDNHCNWCKEAGIKSTPTIYLNNYKLPQHYHIKDLGRILYYLNHQKEVFKA